MPQRIEVPGHGLVEFPDGMSEAEIVKAIQANSAPTSISVGDRINYELSQVPRQLGLTARYGIEGTGQALQPLTEPIRQYITDPVVNLFRSPSVSDLVTGKGKTKSPPMGEMASGVADWFGLPKPQGANERVIADASRLMAGVASVNGIGSLVSKTPGMVGQVGEMMGRDKLGQVVSAGTAGLASGASREAGGGPILQTAAGVLGGLTGQGVISGARSAFNAAGSFLKKPNPRAVEQQISVILERNGINAQDVPEYAMRQLRNQVGDAMNRGNLSTEAGARLLDFNTVRGTQPTRGSLTLDPVEITKERNLSKMGANMDDPALHVLPRIEQQNNRALIENVNGLGAANAPDAYATGRQVIGTVQRGIDAEQAGINSLYQRARDSQGRSLPLEGGTFTRRASELLDQGNVGSFLPPDVVKRLNDIALGKYPLTVDAAEQLKTSIGRLQRNSSDGNTRHALGLVRQALDETPLQQSARANPGNLPAINGSVPASENVLGNEAIDAFNQARAANRSLMGRVQSSPALEAVYNGVEPDQFVKRFIVGGGANVADVQGLRAAIQSDPQAMSAVRANMADWLKRQATGGAADEVANFSAANYRKALDSIGERKLSMFFSPEEITQLRAIGRVASYTSFQPKGSAVNNSNSGALALGKGIDMLSAFASRIPFGNAAISGPIKNIQIRVGQKEATSIPSGLLTPEPRTSFAEKALPALIYGGLLAP